MTRDLIKIHDTSIEILNSIEIYEGFISVAYKQLKSKAAKLFDFDKHYNHKIEIYTMVIKRLFERYENNQLKLNNY